MSSSGSKKISPSSQLDKFKQAAREHEADEDEAHWDDKLKRIVKAKPAPEGLADE